MHAVNKHDKIMLMNRRGAEEQGAAAVVLLIFMTLGFFLASAFGVWAFIGMQANKTDLDQKIKTASAVAVQQAESAKEAEFTEREKSPFRSYSGSSTYGSLTYKFPKSWNVYAEEGKSSTLLDFYAHPGVIPGLGKEVNFAFRTQIVDAQYEKEADRFASSVKSGKVTVEPFRPELVSTELGVIVKGEIFSGKKGAMILLPQRDKTFKLWTESEDYVADFTEIIKTISFVP